MAAWPGGAGIGERAMGRGKTVQQRYSLQVLWQLAAGFGHVVTRLVQQGISCWQGATYG